MKRLLLLGALGGALIAAGPAEAAKVHPCGRSGLAQITKVFHAGISCGDSLVVVRSVEAHKAQCAPYTQQTVAPFRECVVTPALSVGNRNFFCRSAYETNDSNKRYWRTTCKSFSGDVVKYRRDGQYVG